MSREMKIFLAVIGVLVVGCLCACLVGFLLLRSAGSMISNAVVDDPAKVAEIASGMAEYDLPSGYKQVGMDFLGVYQAIFLAVDNETEQPIFMLARFNALGTINQEEFENQMKEVMQQQYSSAGVQWKVVGSMPVTIRGQEVTLTQSEGADSSGKTMRNLLGMFNGQNGPVLLMVMGSVDNWDQAMIDQFIASIR
ncbi:MAG: hypothetical protein JXB15_10925 [Anaerolineales bacterium]|nr:hypothetical protein [Anaerolineales bacterium]